MPINFAQAHSNSRHLAWLEKFDTTKMLRRTWQRKILFRNKSVYVKKRGKLDFSRKWNTS